MEINSILRDVAKRHVESEQIKFDKFAGLQMLIWSFW